MSLCLLFTCSAYLQDHYMSADLVMPNTLNKTHEDQLSLPILASRLTSGNLQGSWAEPTTSSLSGLGSGNLSWSCDFEGLAAVPSSSNAPCNLLESGASHQPFLWSSSSTTFCMLCFSLCALLSFSSNLHIQSNKEGQDEWLWSSSDKVVFRLNRKN